jgi:hypothetical protein
MILLLAPLFPAPVPTMIALAARLWMIIGEVAGAAIALIARNRDRRTVQAGTPALRSEAREA